MGTSAARFRYRWRIDVGRLAGRQLALAGCDTIRCRQSTSPGWAAMSRHLAAPTVSLVPRHTSLIERVRRDLNKRPIAREVVWGVIGFLRIPQQSGGKREVRVDPKLPDMDVVRVGPEAMYLMAPRWQAQTANLVVGAPPPVVLSCQPATSAANAGYAAVAIAAASLTGWVLESATKVTAAEIRYLGNEASLAAQLAPTR